MLRLGGIRRLLVAGRGEIAIRVRWGFAGLRAEDDGRSLHRETDERYCTGKGRGFAAYR